MSSGLEALAEDSAALASAASAAEEALQLEREALSVLRAGWSGDSATAAIDFIDAHCREGEAVVSALRHAAAVLAALGDSADTTGGQVDAGLAERAPSNFSAGVPPPAAAAPAPAMNWPAGGGPAVPDFAGAIADLITQAVDALHSDASVVDPAVEDPPADPVAPPAAATPVAKPPIPIGAPVAPPVDEAPLLAAEVPPPAPVPLVEEPPPVEVPPLDRTPCEIAADELPQVGE